MSSNTQNTQALLGSGGEIQSQSAVDARDDYTKDFEEFDFSEVFEYDQSPVEEEQDAEDEPFVPFLFPGKKPDLDKYPSTDSEVVDKDNTLPKNCKLIPGQKHTMDNFVLQTGYPAPEDLRLCSLRAVITYPEMFIGETNRERVATAFFDKGKAFERKWNVFYLYPGILSKKAIYLVPTSQFEGFLANINKQLGTNLTIPNGGARMNFDVEFPNDGNARPRYFGESSSKAMIDQMKVTPPPSHYRPDKGLIPEIKAGDLHILEQFKRKVEALLKVERKSKANNKARKQKERAAKQDACRYSLECVQRYVGLREINLANPELRSTELDVNLPAPFSMEEDIVFVCVDVEAYEHNHSLITEIGIATLDTRDITPLAPKVGAKEWFRKIRARHFRVQEYSSLRNRDFVAGCPDRFEFGESEFVPLKDAPSAVASCFKAPFSGPAEEGKEPTSKRKVVVVGHDVLTDVKYLRDFGYQVLNLPPHAVVDTADLYRYLRKENSNRGLSGVLADLGIEGWNLHNAGNDAVYTLQAMLAIALVAAKEAESGKNDGIDEQRLAEAVNQTRSLALDNQRGWSGDGEFASVPHAEPFDPFSGKAPGNAAKVPGSEGSSSSEWQLLPSLAGPDLSLLKEMASRATKSDDQALINELAKMAAENRSFNRLMKAAADGTISPSQLEQFELKVENAKSLLAWEEEVEDSL